MRKIALVEIGNAPYEYIKEAAEKSLYEIIYVGHDYELEILKRKGVTNQMVGYESLVKPCLTHPMKDSSCYSKIYEEIMDDLNIHLLNERVNGIRLGFQSDFNDMLNLDMLIEQTIHFINGKEIAFFYAMTCPHYPQSWVFANVLEKMGVPVYYSNVTVFQWRCYLLKGLRKAEIQDVNSGCESDTIAEDHIVKISESYDKIIPYYEKERLKKTKGKYWSWKQECKYCINSPRKLYSLILKRKLYKAFLQYSTTPVDDNLPYILVFLHFQPERTTLPEGGYYVNQWHIVNSIHRQLPKGYKLYVKEHPSVYTGSSFDFRYKNPLFYKYVSSLPNTYLLSPYIDNFTLIDKAACITTVTGTVAGESLFRGTPVLVFGNATCRDNKYVFRINNDLDIKYALSQIENISKDDVRTYMHKEYVSQVLRKSFAGYDKLEDINLPEYGRTRFAKANCKVLSAILIGKVAVN